MSISTRNTPSSRLPRIGAIGIALAGGLLLAGQAAAVQPLAISAVAMSAAAEGKCGEGKCGANKATTGKPAGKPRLITNPKGRIPLLIAGIAILSLVVGIYVTVIVGACTKILGVNNTFTLDNFKYVLSGIGNESILDTTLLALIATPIAGVLGMVMAWLIVRKVKRGSGLLDFLGMLGLAVPGTVVGIGYAIRRLVDEGQAVLLVEQNLRFATELCDRILVMVNGRIAADLSAAELAHGAEIQNRYLGVV